MAGRKTLAVALALIALGVISLASAVGVLFRETEAAAVACSSCDARHQSPRGLVAKRAAETMP
jgi:hypothetical protein